MADCATRLGRPSRSRCASRPGPAPRGLSSGQPTLTGVLIDHGFGGRFDIWLAGRPPWVWTIAGLVLVAGLGYLDFATGPDLSPLPFYLAPIVVVTWYAGRSPGLAIACASAVAWLLSDALTHGDYAHWSIPYLNGALRLGALALMAETVARLRAARARERDLARRDPRTGIANLHAFYELAGAEIARARRYPHAFSLAYIDLDEFQLVNLRLGHEAGDAVLRSVARALTGVLRASDAVARIDGDQFAVLLPEAGAAAARLAVDKLRQALADVVPAHGWRVTASIGLATFLVPPESVDALLAAPDRLMHRAKKGGKNVVVHETQNEAPVLR
jgi:diguanylate cyclase (GGDEF)-like protein